MKIAVWLLFIVFMGVILWGSYIYIFQIDNEDRKFSFMTGLYTNIFSSLIIGFLVGLAIYVIQNDEQVVANEKAQKISRLEAEDRLLTLVQADISRNLNAAKQKKTASDPNDTVNKIMNYPMDSSIWRGLSSSGEIKFLNAEIIAKLSIAYSAADRADFWEKRYIESRFGAASALSFTTNNQSIPVASVVSVYYLTGIVLAEGEMKSASELVQAAADANAKALKAEREADH